MSKHSELAQLLTAFELAVRNHAAASRPGTIVPSSYVVSLYEVADKAEKRIFSFFDQMQAAHDAESRKVDNMRKLRDHVVIERDRAEHALDSLKKQLYDANSALAELRDCRNPFAIPAPNVPFDEAAAVAGKPVQVLYDGVWRDVKYIGTGEYGRIVECGSWAQSSLSYWGVENMRMKPKATQRLQMFANVRRASSGAIFGALYESSSVAELNASAANSSGTPLATATPVTITVAD